MSKNRTETGLLDRFSAGAVAIAAVLAILAALSPDRPPVAIAATVLLIGSLGRITWQRVKGSPSAMGIIVAWVMLLLLAAAALVIPSSRDIAIHNLLGFAQAPEIRVAAIRVSEGPVAYRVVIDIANDASSDYLVRKVRLVAALISSAGCDGGAPYEYRVADTLKIKQRRAAAVVSSTTVSEAAAPAYTYGASGVVSGACLSQRLAVEFPAGIRLPAQQISEVAIDLPEEFKIVADKSRPHPSSHTESVVHLTLPVSSAEETGDSDYLKVELEAAGYSTPITGSTRHP
jgi:hypothetical protein